MNLIESWMVITFLIIKDITITLSIITVLYFMSELAGLVCITRIEYREAGFNSLRNGAQPVPS